MSAKNRRKSPSEYRVTMRGEDHSYIDIPTRAVRFDLGSGNVPSPNFLEAQVRYERSLDRWVLDISGNGDIAIVPGKGYSNVVVVNLDA